MFGTVSINKAKAIADLGAVNAAGSGMGAKLGKVFKTLGKVAVAAFAVVGVAAAGIFVVAIKKAAAFQASMAMVKSVTGATTEEFEALEVKAKELGKTSKFTMTDIAEGMEFLGRAGFTTTEIIEAMDGVTALAASQVMDLGRAADITSNILTGMGLEAGEAGRVADVLALTAASANVNVEMLGESFKYAAPLAAAAGWSIEETAAAIGKMGDAGIQGSMAGTALRFAIAELIGESDNFKDKLGELGMKMDDLKGPDGQLLGMAEVFGVFEERGFGAAEMLSLFGKRAGPGMAILLTQGEESLANYTTELEAAGNELELLYVQTGFVETGADLLRQQIEALTAVFLSADNPIANAGERAEELVTAVSDGTMSFAEFQDAISEAGVDLDEYGDFAEIAYKNLTTLADETQQAESLTTKLAEALERGGLSTKEAASLAEELTTAVRDGSMSFEEFEAAIEAAGADMDAFGGTAQRMADIYLETLAGQVDVLKGSWDLLLVTLAEDLLPIIASLLEDHIIPLVNGITEWIEVQGGLLGVIDKVKGKIIEFASTLRDKMGVAWDTAVAAADRLVEGLKRIGTFITDHSGPITKAIIAIGAAFAAWQVAAWIASLNPLTIALSAIAAAGMAVAAFWPEITAAWEKAKSILANNESVVAAWNTIKDVANVVWGELKKIFTGIKDWAVDAFKIIKDYAVEQFNVIKDFLGAVFRGDWEGAWTSLKDIAVNAFELIKEQALLVWEHLPIPDETKTKIIDTLTSIKDGAITAFNWIKEKALEAWAGIKASIEEYAPGIIAAWDDLKEAGVALWDALKEAGGAAWDALKEVFASITGAFGEMGENAISFRDIVKGVFDVILITVTTVLGGITDLFNIFAAALRGDWSQVWVEFKNFLAGIWDGIVKILDIIDLKDAIIAGWEDLKVRTVQIWGSIKDSISAIWDGIVSWFSNALQRLVDTVTSWMPGWMRKWLGVGKDAGQNLADGLVSKEGTVESAANKLADAITKPLSMTKETIKKIGADLGETLSLALAGTQSDIEKTAEDLGKAIPEGMAKGILDSTPLIESTIAGVNQAAQDQFMLDWKMRSPSRLAYGYGSNIMAGLADGIKAGIAQVKEWGNLLLDALPGEPEFYDQGKEGGDAYTDGLTNGIEAGAPSILRAEEQFQQDWDASHAAHQAEVVTNEEIHHEGILREEEKFQQTWEASHVAHHDTIETETAGHHEEMVQEEKSFWTRLKEKVETGTADIAQVIGGFLNDIKNTLKSGLGDMLVDIVHYGETHADEEEAHLQRIADINEDYAERLATATGDEYEDIKAARDAALAQEETDYEESRTTITGIISTGFEDMATAILDSGLKKAVDTAIDWLWDLAFEAAAAETATSTALSNISSGASGTLSNIGGSLSGLGSLIWNLAGIATPIFIGTSSDVANWVHDVNHWLNSLFGQTGPGWDEVEGVSSGGDTSGWTDLPPGTEVPDWIPPNGEDEGVWTHGAAGGLAVSSLLALIGEGRHDEALLPLNDAVYARLGAGIAKATGGSLRPIEVNVELNVDHLTTDSPGQIDALCETLGRRIGFRLRGLGLEAA